RSGDLLAGGLGRGAHRLRLLGGRLVRLARLIRRAVAGLAGLGRLGRLLVLLVLLGVRGDRAVAAVRAIKARALEHDPDRGEHLAEPAAARGAYAQRIVGELLHSLDRLTAIGAGVLICGHGPSSTRASG